MKIELAELQRIATRSQDIDTSLNAEFTQMASTLEEICVNINSSELTASNQNLTKAIADVSNKVKTNLPAIIEFLKTQITSYQATNANTKEQLDSLISSVNSTFGN